MVQQSANWRELNGKDGKYRISKAVFTIFALDLTVVCTFFA